MTEEPITLQQAEEAIDSFDQFPFFNQVGGPARAAIVASLLSLVNVPCPEHEDYCECPRPALRNRDRIVVAKPPAARLAAFLTAFYRLPGWPGIGQMEALYCALFPPGDGLQRPDCEIPGYTPEDNENETNIPLIPLRPAVPMIGSCDEKIDGVAMAMELAKQKRTTTVC